MSRNPLDAVVSDLALKTKKELAVLDIETTGVYRHSDRIIEIAILSCDIHGNVKEEFVTLINPHRDLGPAQIHRIKAADVIIAPAFEEIAGDIIERLQGRVIVGHNVDFDLGFLAAEYLRLGVQTPSPDNICTMRLAFEFGPSRRRLSDCCEHFGIPSGECHSALDDAHSALGLLKAYLNLAKERHTSEMDKLSAFCAGDLSTPWPNILPSGKSCRRGSSSMRAADSYLLQLTARLPEVGSIDTASYYSMLDRILEDRRISADEADELFALACSTGISKDAAIAANREYLRQLAEAAMADGYVSKSEMEELELVAAFLGFEPSYAQEILRCAEQSEVKAPQSSEALSKFAGKTVCFSGAMNCSINGRAIDRETAHRIACEHGLSPCESVTRSTDILVLADPDSLSGKAQKARKYGTRILADRVFWRELGVAID